MIRHFDCQFLLLLLRLQHVKGLLRPVQVARIVILRLFVLIFGRVQFGLGKAVLLYQEIILSLNRF